VSTTQRAVIQFSLPHRDLHAERKTKVWLLRVAIHDEWRNGGQSGLEGRPCQLKTLGTQHPHRKRGKALSN